MKKRLYSCQLLARFIGFGIAKKPGNWQTKVTLNERVFCLLLTGLTLVSCQKNVEPSGCQLVVQESISTYTYQFDQAGKLTQIHTNTGSNEADFWYTYQGRQATIEVTYPKTDYLRIMYDLTLNEQGNALTVKETVFNRLADGTTQQSITATHTFAYDNQGHLTEHHADKFTYPPGASKKTETYQEQLTYQDGNPVDIVLTYSAPTPQVIRVRNRYDGHTNPLTIPFLVESNPFGFSADWYLQPFLGKPAQHLIAGSDLTETGRQIPSTSYTYQIDAGGQLKSVARTGSQANGLSFSNNCP
ncbi:DUF4595 domain-containing protein [Spirosoma utsteinense]|uniref:YD repeat-containing protein n=1 Tax=Spirosoma utsteinense TaxID=2585773 RepID=A0ABR6W5H0_9BACT|nr:DUF4595 domain-containing protein [Spirosoma utsteinense]MBC3785639.1 YD repeat-containing protein [Spirosoma utsteinense]MBC3791790.1 YD repeat-containing protein [Spirosoma utsteinense]